MKNLVGYVKKQFEKYPQITSYNFWGVLPQVVSDIGDELSNNKSITSFDIIDSLVIAYSHVYNKLEGEENKRKFIDYLKSVWEEVGNAFAEEFVKLNNESTEKESLQSLSKIATMGILETGNSIRIFLNEVSKKGYYGDLSEIVDSVDI